MRLKTTAVCLLLLTGCLSAKGSHSAVHAAKPKVSKPHKAKVSKPHKPRKLKLK